MLSWLTKNPAKSMNGMITIGVNDTATYLFDTAEPISKPLPPPAMYKEIAMKTKMKKCSPLSVMLRPKAKYVINESSVGSIMNKGISLEILAK